MKSSHWLVAALVVMSAVGSPLAGDKGNNTIDSIADASFKLDPGRFEGSVVYVDFWASWCKPCQKSFAWLRRMHQLYGKDGLVILAVGVDKNSEKAQRFLDKTSPPFRIIFDPEGKMAAAYHLETMPSSFLYDRSGKLQVSHVGFHEKDTGELERSIRQLLAADAQTPKGEDGAAP